MTDASVGVWLNGVGGLAVAALGAFVLSVRPRTVQSRTLGLFALGFGSNYLVVHGVTVAHLPEGVLWLQAPAQALWIVGAVGIGLHLPRPLQGHERRYAWAALPVVVALVGLAFAARGTVALTSSRPLLFGLLMTGQAVLLACFLLVTARFALSRDAEFRTQAAIMAGGVALFVAFVAGYGSTYYGDDGVLRATGAGVALAWTRLLLTIGAGLAWIALARPPAARAARNVGLLTLGLVLVGLATPAPGGHGLVRLLMALVLAYAILKHQLLGIDVRLRWTISRSTTAAVFIAVFFIAGEGAQLLFGTENQWVGLAAAGLLVFALAPLQRAADRLAEKAVPGAATASAAQGRNSREAAYAAAVRRYLRDGVITRDEERELAHLAGELGIHAGRAYELRDQAAAEHKARPRRVGR